MLTFLDGFLTSILCCCVVHVLVTYVMYVDVKRRWGCGQTRGVRNVIMYYACVCLIKDIGLQF